METTLVQWPKFSTHRITGLTNISSLRSHSHASVESYVSSTTTWYPRDASALMIPSSSVPWSVVPARKITSLSESLIPRALRALTMAAGPQLKSSFWNLVTQ